MRPLPHGQNRTPLIITRRQHPLLKELRELRDRPHPDLLFLEGPKLVEEALQASIVLKTLISTTDFKDSSKVLERAKARAESTFAVSDSIFRSFSDLVEPQGILAIGERPRWSWEQLFAKSPAPIIILDGLQNPGNVSAVVRTAEAAGAAGVITTPGTARLTSPKALRGASGSVLRLPTLEHLKSEEIVERLRKANYKLYCTSAASQTPPFEKGRPGGISPHDQIPPNPPFSKGGIVWTDADWTQPVAIVMGQEGNGVSDGWKAEIVTIPMEKPVESLNVAAAAAILLYEAARQRRTNK